MRKRHVMLAMGLGVCSAISALDIASAQMPLPAAKSVPDGTALFKQQCATCHTTSLSDAPRQGPPLVQIIGRQAGKFEGFRYSSGLAQADFTWDEEKLDAWLSNPQDLVPGSVMAYRQTKDETRAAIITYLKGLN
jgi:cytochrome c